MLGNRKGEVDEDEEEQEQEEAASGRTRRAEEERKVSLFGHFSKCMWPTDGLSCCPSPPAHPRTILCTYLFSKTGCCWFRLPVSRYGMPLRLGQCTRDTPSLLEEGVNIEVVWSTNVKLLLFSNHTLETIGLSCMLQPMKMGHMWQLLGEKALFSTISRVKDSEFLGMLIKNEKFSIGLVWLGRIIVLYNYREATKM